YPHFTPTAVEGDVGSTLQVEFKLDGYAPKSAEVYVGEGERPFNAKLERLEAPPPAPAPPQPPKHEHKPRPAVAAKEPVGKATLSVFVRPWAIVYVDGARLRQTPVQAYELNSGKHTIELVNESKAKREKMIVNLNPGDTHEIRLDWDK